MKENIRKGKRQKINTPERERERERAREREVQPGQNEPRRGEEI